MKVTMDRKETDEAIGCWLGKKGIEFTSIKTKVGKDSTEVEIINEVTEEILSKPAGRDENSIDEQDDTCEEKTAATPAFGA